MRTTKYTLFIILILLLPFGLANCKQSSITKKARQEAAKAERKTVQPQSEAEEEGDIFKLEEEELFKSEGYAYEPGKRRDPFVPLVVVKRKQDTKRRTKKAPVNAPPLQSFDVSEFKVIATASGKDGFFAMLKAPDNKAYTVYKGTKIGFNDGTIVEINMNEVIVEELVENEFNKLEPRKIILSLRKEE